MSKSVLLGGVIGGVVLFLWGALAHLALGLGSAGMSRIPQEEKVIAAMKETMPQAGLYFFPWLEESGDRGAPDRPSGLLAYSPRGDPGMTASRLLVELASDIVLALIAGALLCKASSALSDTWRRVLFVTLLGLLPWLALSVSYWNWYGFPTAYLLAEGVDQVAGFALMGLVLARLVRPRTS